MKKRKLCRKQWIQVTLKEDIKVTVYVEPRPVETEEVNELIVQLAHRWAGSKVGADRKEPDDAPSEVWLAFAMRRMEHGGVPNTPMGRKLLGWIRRHR